VGQENRPLVPEESVRIDDAKPLLHAHAVIYCDRAIQRSPGRMKYSCQNPPARLRLMKIISMQARKPSVQIGPATMTAFLTKAPDKTLGAS